MNSDLLLVIVHFANEIMFEFTEDDEEKAIVPKVKQFAEETVPRFETHQFRQHFRLLPGTFEKLLGYLFEVKVKEHKRPDGHQEMNLDKQLMITIWYLANLESFRSVASRFDISKSTCWNVLQRTAHRMLKVNQLYGIIRWPTEEEALQTMEIFERRSHIPGIVGCIDGSHIRILPPTHFPNSYLNRKKFHSVLVQGVCNHNKLFIDIYAGEPGSIHDSNLFNKSDLSERIRNQSVTFYNNSHLIGDLAYKLTTTLMVGFKNYGNLTPREINFNKRLNSCRVEIENALALLKGRFRRLKFMETIRLDFISLFLVTAALLHNACLLNDDLPYEFVNINEELEEERRDNLVEEINQVAEDNNARQKRLDILYNLPL